MGEVVETGTEGAAEGGIEAAVWKKVWREAGAREMGVPSDPTTD